MEGSGGDCYHFVLGSNKGTKGHAAPMGHLMTQFAIEEHRTILKDLNWTCTQCGKAQHGPDGSCCGFEAKDHLAERIKEFSAIAYNQKPRKAIMLAIAWMCQPRTPSINQLVTTQILLSILH